jgi:hypothetical protein
MPSLHDESAIPSVIAVFVACLPCTFCNERVGSSETLPFRWSVPHLVKHGALKADVHAKMTRK